MPTRAPIALFIFNRPGHLRKTLTALAQCAGFADTPVFVFGDGARGPEDAALVAAARAVARDVLGDRATYVFADSNMGLSRSVIAGVTSVLAAHGRVIVLEDDLDLAPGFLTYMNAALEHFETEAAVFQIAGYAFDAPELAGRQQAALLPFCTTWGWGTWRRAWDHFDADAAGWDALTSDKALRRRFNLGGVYDYATMMERQMAGKRDSWGIRWYWSVFRHNGLVLYPPRTFVRNTGFDGSGSHGRGMFRRFGGARAAFADDADVTMPAVRLDQEAFAAVRHALYRQNGGALGMVADVVKRSVGRFIGR